MIATFSYQLIAQGINNPALGPGLQGINGVSFFQKLFPALVGLGFVIGVVIFFFMFLIGAVSWITSGGDKAAHEAARNRIRNAIVGLFILLALFAIIRLLEIFFATNLVRINIGPLFIGETVPGPGPVGNANCPCSVALGGGCATTGTIAVGPGSECYQCTPSGWNGPVGGSCGAISCLPCP